MRVVRSEPFSVQPIEQARNCGTDSVTTHLFVPLASERNPPQNEPVASVGVTQDRIESFVRPVKTTLLAPLIG